MAASRSGGQLSRRTPGVSSGVLLLGAACLLLALQLAEADWGTCAAPRMYCWWYPDPMCPASVFRSLPAAYEMDVEPGRNLPKDGNGGTVMDPRVDYANIVFTERYPGGLLNPWNSSDEGTEPFRWEVSGLSPDESSGFNSNYKEWMIGYPSDPSDPTFYYDDSIPVVTVASDYIIDFNTTSPSLWAIDGSDYYTFLEAMVFDDYVNYDDWDGHAKTYCSSCMSSMDRAKYVRFDYATRTQQLLTRDEYYGKGQPNAGRNYPKEASTFPSNPTGVKYYIQYSKYCDICWNYGIEGDNNVNSKCQCDSRNFRTFNPGLSDYCTICTPEDAPEDYCTYCRCECPNTGGQGSIVAFDLDRFSYVKALHAGSLGCDCKLADPASPQTKPVRLSVVYNYNSSHESRTAEYLRGQTIVIEITYNKPLPAGVNLLGCGATLQVGNGSTSFQATLKLTEASNDATYATSNLRFSHVVTTNDSNGDVMISDKAGALSFGTCAAQLQQLGFVSSLVGLELVVVDGQAKSRYGFSDTCYLPCMPGGSGFLPSKVVEDALEIDEKSAKFRPYAAIKKVLAAVNGGQPMTMPGFWDPMGKAFIVDDSCIRESNTRVYGSMTSPNPVKYATVNVAQRIDIVPTAIRVYSPKQAVAVTAQSRVPNDCFTATASPSRSVVFTVGDEMVFAVFFSQLLTPRKMVTDLVFQKDQRSNSNTEVFKNAVEELILQFQSISFDDLYTGGCRMTLATNIEMRDGLSSATSASTVRTVNAKAQLLPRELYNEKTFQFGTGAKAPGNVLLFSLKVTEEMASNPNLYLSNLLNDPSYPFETFDLCENSLVSAKPISGLYATAWDWAKGSVEKCNPSGGTKNPNFGIDFEVSFASGSLLDSIFRGITVASVDTFQNLIVDVYTTKKAGPYVRGDVIDINLRFARFVVLGNTQAGLPLLHVTSTNSPVPFSLTTASTDKEGTSVLTFYYTVGASDASEKTVGSRVLVFLDVVTLDLNGCVIQDVRTGRNANVTLPKDKLTQGGLVVSPVMLDEYRTRVIDSVVIDKDSCCPAGLSATEIRPVKLALVYSYETSNLTHPAELRQGDVAQIDITFSVPRGKEFPAVSNRAVCGQDPTLAVEFATITGAAVTRQFTLLRSEKDENCKGDAPGATAGLWHVSFSYDIVGNELDGISPASAGRIANIRVANKQKALSFSNCTLPAGIVTDLSALPLKVVDGLSVNVENDDGTCFLPCIGPQGVFSYGVGPINRVPCIADDNASPLLRYAQLNLAKPLSIAPTLFSVYAGNDLSAVVGQDNVPAPCFATSTPPITGTAILAQGDDLVIAVRFQRLERKLKPLASPSADGKLADVSDVPVLREVAFRDLYEGGCRMQLATNIEYSDSTPSKRHYVKADLIPRSRYLDVTYQQGTGVAPPNNVLLFSAALSADMLSQPRILFPPGSEAGWPFSNFANCANEFVDATSPDSVWSWSSGAPRLCKGSPVPAYGIDFKVFYNSGSEVKSTYTTGTSVSFDSFQNKVLDIYTLSPAGNYSDGNVIISLVKFARPITVTNTIGGLPRLYLNSALSPVEAYVSTAEMSAEGVQVLKFSYAVGPGDASESVPGSRRLVPLDIRNSSSLDANGATIQDARSSRPALLMLPVGRLAGHNLVVRPASIEQYRARAAAQAAESPSCRACMLADQDRVFRPKRVAVLYGYESANPTNPAEFVKNQVVSIDVTFNKRLPMDAAALKACKPTLQVGTAGAFHATLALAAAYNDAACPATSHLVFSYKVAPSDASGAVAIADKAAALAIAHCGADMSGDLTGLNLTVVDSRTTPTATDYLGSCYYACINPTNLAAASSLSEDAASCISDVNGEATVRYAAVNTARPINIVPAAFDVYTSADTVTLAGQAAASSACFATTAPQRTAVFAPGDELTFVVRFKRLERSVANDDVPILSDVEFDDLFGPACAMTLATNVELASDAAALAAPAGTNSTGASTANYARATLIPRSRYLDVTFQQGTGATIPRDVLLFSMPITKAMKSNPRVWFPTGTSPGWPFENFDGCLNADVTAASPNSQSIWDWAYGNAALCKPTASSGGLKRSEYGIDGTVYAASGSEEDSLWTGTTTISVDTFENKVLDIFTTMPVGSKYTEGAVVDINVRFARPVRLGNVNPDVVPQLKLNSRRAPINYTISDEALAAAGTSILTFYYNVGVGDASETWVGSNVPVPLDVNGTTALASAGAIIRDARTRKLASLSPLPVGNLASYRVRIYAVSLQETPEDYNQGVLPNANETSAQQLATEVQLSNNTATRRRALQQLALRIARDSPLLVQCFLQFNSIFAVSERDQSFKADVVVVYSWIDRRFANPRQQALVEGNAPVLARIWEPLLTFTNVREKPQEFDVRVTIKNDGSVKVYKRFIQTFFSEMDVSKYPFDTQTFKIGIRSSTWSSSQLTYIPGDVSDQEIVMKNINDSQFRYYSYSQYTIQQQSGIFKSFDVLWTTVRAARMSTYNSVNILFPIALIILAVITTYFMPLKSDGRVSVCAVGISATLGFSFVVQAASPPVSYITRMALYIMMAYIICIVSLAVQIFIRFLHGLTEDMRQDLAQEERERLMTERELKMLELERRREDQMQKLREERDKRESRMLQARSAAVVKAVPPAPALAPAKSKGPGPHADLPAIAVTTSASDSPPSSDNESGGGPAQIGPRREPLPVPAVVARVITNDGAIEVAPQSEKAAATEREGQRREAEKAGQPFSWWGETDKSKEEALARSRVPIFDASAFALRANEKYVFFFGRFRLDYRRREKYLVRLERINLVARCALIFFFILFTPLILAVWP